MKKLTAIFIAIMVLISALPAFAEPISENGFTYTLRGDAAVIQAYTGMDEEVTIPATLGGFSVEAIAQNAFWGTQIRAIEFPSSLRAIGNNAFSCSALESVSLPEDFVELAPYAFAASPALKDVTIPEGVFVIPNMAFGECSSLVCVNLPSTIRRIEDAAFISCAALTDIALPEGLAEIEDTVFYGCAALKTLALPDSITAIGEDVFYGCPDITLLVSSGSYAETYAKENDIPFEYVQQRSVGIPAELVGTWKGVGTPVNGSSEISLEFVICADGTGSYTFEQAGYVESQPITVNPGEGSFAVEALQNNRIGLTACEGTYIYEDGALILSITSTLASGREFRYVAECLKQQPNAFALPNGVHWASSMDEVMTAVGVNASLQSYGNLTIITADDVPFVGHEAEITYLFFDGALRFVECMLYNPDTLPDVKAALTEMYGEPNMTDLSRFLELVEGIGGSFADQASVEATPWSGWTLTDSGTGIFTTSYDGSVGVFYMYDGASAPAEG